MYKWSILPKKHENTGKLWLKDMFNNNQDVKIHLHLQTNMMKNTKNTDMN